LAVTAGVDVWQHLEGQAANRHFGQEVRLGAVVVQVDRRRVRQPQRPWVGVQAHEACPGRRIGSDVGGDRLVEDEALVGNRLVRRVGRMNVEDEIGTVRVLDVIGQLHPEVEANHSNSAGCCRRAKSSFARARAY